MNQPDRSEQLKYQPTDEKPERRLIRRFTENAHFVVLDDVMIDCMECGTDRVHVSLCFQRKAGECLLKHAAATEHVLLEQFSGQLAGEQHHFVSLKRAKKRHLRSFKIKLIQRFRHPVDEVFSRRDAADSLMEFVFNPALLLYKDLVNQQLLGWEKKIKCSLGDADPVYQIVNSGLFDTVLCDALKRFLLEVCNNEALFFIGITLGDNIASFLTKLPYIVSIGDKKTAVNIQVIQINRASSDCAPDSSAHLVRMTHQHLPMPHVRKDLFFIVPEIALEDAVRF